MLAPDDVSVLGDRNGANEQLQIRDWAPRGLGAGGWTSGERPSYFCRRGSGSLTSCRRGSSSLNCWCLPLPEKGIKPIVACLTSALRCACHRFSFLHNRRYKPAEVPTGVAESGDATIG